MTVWLVSYDCGDYYHDGEHIVGVFATKDDADAAVITHDAMHLEAWRSGYYKYEYSVYEVTVGEIDNP